jgi:hypothetical protein
LPAKSMKVQTMIIGGGATAGGLLAVMSLWNTFAPDTSPPWASRVSVSVVQMQLAQLQADTRDAGRRLSTVEQTLLFNNLGEWQVRLSTAEEMLKQQPDNSIAMQMRDIARQQIEQISRQLGPNPPAQLLSRPAAQIGEP